jgi:O-antigen/teichoic acid export membrane protein
MCPSLSPFHHQFTRDRLRRISREAVWIALGQAASIVAQLAMVKVLTSRLAPSEYGRLALGLAAAAVVGQTTMVVASGIGRFYSPAAEEGQLSDFGFAMRGLLRTATAVTASAWAVLALCLWMTGRSDLVPLSAVLCVMALVGGWNGAMNGVQAAARHRPVVAWHTGFEAWLRVALAIALTSSIGSTSTVAAGAYMLAAVGALCSNLLFAKRLLPEMHAGRNHKLCHEWRSRIWSFSWPFAAWGVLTWAQQSSDRWALEWSAGAAEVGAYVVVIQLGYAPILTATGLGVTLLSPILYQRAGDGTHPHRVASVRRVIGAVATVAFVLTLTGIATALLLHRQLFAIFVGAEFQSQSHLLPWAVAAGGMFAAGQCLSLQFLSEAKSSRLIVVKVVTALFGIGANGVGAALWGAKGVVIALCAFSLVYLLAVLTLFRKKTDPSPDPVT